MKLIALAIAILIAVSTAGCASVNQAYSAAAASALVDAQGAEDNALRTLVVGVCATPISAAIRHPEIVPGITALCLPGGNLSSPAVMLGKMQTPTK